ncbi:MAG: UDP-N-acetylglucosamine--N-acetylmuramyl-(pentapeptide) pyrophosphoryl-undecaprenol N-acetylglucosamine transferase [Vulcanimicrobiaceae bacterium]
MKVVLTGGGTGGHIYPALAIAEALRDEPDVAPLELLFVGTRDGLEAKIVPRAGLALAYVHAAPLVRKQPAAIAHTLFENARGLLDALGVMHRFQPDVAIATGGYVAFPVIAALRLVRALHRTNAKLVLLEPNARAGLTNRLLGPLVDEVWLALAPAGGLGAKQSLTGTPVRAALRRELSAEDGRRELGLAPRLTTVVVMGGSQGARSINEALKAMLTASALPEGWQVLIVSGERDFASMKPLEQAAQSPGRVRVIAYLDDPRAAYAAADLVLARAGASTLGELAATGTPALLVPYPHATDDHQAHNAEAVRAAGAARVLRDGDLGAARLRAELEAALDPPVLAAMRAAARTLGSADPCTTIRARVKRWSPKNNYNP